MAQQRIDRSGNQSDFAALASIDSNFDDIFDVMQISNADFTFVAKSGFQPLFNASPNGALNVPVGLFEFECQFDATNVSAATNSVGFALGGTATLDSQKWWALARAGVETTSTGPSATYNAASQNNMITVSSSPEAWAWIRGIFRVSAGGTIIPQISFSVFTGDIPTIKKNSFFRAKKLSQVFGATIIQPPLPRSSPNIPFWS